MVDSDKVTYNARSTQYRYKCRLTGCSVNNISIETNFAVANFVD